MTELTMRNERRLRLGFGIDAMKKQKVCARCGTVSDADETQCRSCGEALPRETLYEFYRARHKQCESCHAIVSGDALFCPACGRKIQAETETGEKILFMERNTK